MNNHLEKECVILEAKLGFYFGRLISYPLVPPEHVYFPLTNRCNLRCKMCNIPNSANREQVDLTFKECKRVIDQIVDLRINHLIFSGGEPLLRKDIFDLIAYAVNKRIKMVDMITNGVLVDETVAKRLIRFGMNHITVSIDGLEEANDFIRGKDSFKKAIEAIDLINKYKNNNLPTVGINFTIMNYNFNQILPIIDLARTKKCNIIVLQPMLSDNTEMQERKKNELWISEDNMHKLKEIIREVLELKKILQDISIHVNEKILEMIPAYFAGLPLDRDLKCYENIVRIVITNNGDLWSCQGIYGNLRKGSLKDIWFSREANNIRCKVKNCQSHCLQSCIHLAEISDIYSEITKFKTLVDKQGETKKYINRLMTLLANYKSRLKRQQIIRYFQNMVKPDKKDSLKELNLEIVKISKTIKDLS